MKRQKVSLALDPELVADLDYISSRFGVSRSALVSVLMAGPASDARKMLSMVPDSPTALDLIRFRGESAELARQRLESLKGLADDLFSGQ